MKKKWIPHIIAVVALVIFIVLGLASATMEEESQRRATDGKGGILIVKNTSSNTDYLCVVYPTTGTGWAWRMLAGQTAGRNIHFYENSEYEVRYIRNQPDFDVKSTTKENTNHWYKKSGYISNDERVTVNIP